MIKNSIASEIFVNNNVSQASYKAKIQSVIVKRNGNGSTEYVFSDGSILVLDVNDSGMFVSRRLRDMSDLEQPGHQPENFGGEG